MEKDSGKWIMYGVDWDDPECIHTVDEAIEYINEIGFLPLFRNDIPGFSLEERTVPEYWWCEDVDRDPWMGRLSQEDMTSYMASFLIKRQVLYRENGFLYLPITDGMDMILMRCMRMEKPRISIKRSWIILWKNMWIQNCIPTN